MYYLIADIHGYINRLTSLYEKVRNNFTDKDRFIFLGDYIDRGPASYEVVDFLISLSKRHSVVFLKGNHEDMFLNYLVAPDEDNRYLVNGGSYTIQSYKKNTGSLTLPPHHRKFYDNLQLYYEGDDFIAVHAGLDPGLDKIDAQCEFDICWIRENFYRSDRKWDKTVIFGHTPAFFLGATGRVHIDTEKNIIGIDNGVIYNRDLVCMRWPDKKIFTSG
jgi:serine/threonine protein phosphatase 1